MTPVTYHERPITGLNYYWAATSYPTIRSSFIGYPDMGLARFCVVPKVAGDVTADKYNHEFWDIELAAPDANFYPRLNADGLRLFVGLGSLPASGKMEVLKKINGKVESQIFSHTEFLNR